MLINIHLADTLCEPVLPSRSGKNKRKAMKKTKSIKKTEAKKKKIDHPHRLPAVGTGGEAAAESTESIKIYYRLRGEEWRLPELTTPLSSAKLQQAGIVWTQFPNLSKFQ